MLRSWLERIRKKKEPPPRRDVLESSEQVLGSSEALERISRAVQQYPPGTSARWDNMINLINTNEEPSKDIPDPLRLHITKDVLKVVLRDLYEKKRSIQSDGLALAREFIPLMYDKHTVERGMNVSQRERDQKDITDACYAYGELDHEIFAAMYLRVTSVFGERDNGIFYDLGCGVGTLVYAAAFIGNFDRVIGVENITSLLERGEKRAGRWERFQSNYSEKIRNIIFDWIEDDFMENGFWNDGTCILLHWTAFSNIQQNLISNLLSSCQEGTYVISFTNPVPGDDFDILVHDTCVTSWGKADFYFQEKITTATERGII